MTGGELCAAAAMRCGKARARQLVADKAIVRPATLSENGLHHLHVKVLVGMQ